MFLKNRTIDTVTLVDALVQGGYRDKSGGIQYLTQIAQVVPSAANIADYAKIGCRYAAVPYVTPERRPGAEKFWETVKTIGELGKCAKKYGLTLLYHFQNHCLHITIVLRRQN